MKLIKTKMNYVNLSIMNRMKLVLPKINKHWRVQSLKRSKHFPIVNNSIMFRDSKSPIFVQCLLDDVLSVQKGYRNLQENKI